MKISRTGTALASLAVAVVLALTGCPKDPAATNDTIPLAEGEVRGGVYTHPGFGWTMKVPAGWRVKTREEVTAMMEKGLATVQKSSGESLDVSGAVNLLHLQLDPFSHFTSTAEKFDPAQDGAYADNQKAVLKLMLDAYADAGLKVRHTRRTETVGGVLFDVTEATILAADGETLVLHQAMYDVLLGTRSLTVSLNWKSDATRDALFAAWRGSTFSAPTAAAPAAVNAR